MKLLQCILVACLILASNESYGQSIVGVWQVGKPGVSSGLTNHYTFYANGTFEYAVNSDAGLQRVKAIGGTYTYSKGELKLLTKYTVEVQGGTIDRSTINDSDDSWTIVDGKQIKRPLPSPAWFGIEVKLLTANTATFDSRSYYKVSSK